MSKKLPSAMPKMIVLVDGVLTKNVQLTKSPTFFEPRSYSAMPIKTLAKKLRQPRARLAELIASDANREIYSLKMDGMVKARMRLANLKLVRSARTA